MMRCNLLAPDGHVPLRAMEVLRNALDSCSHGFYLNVGGLGDTMLCLSAHRVAAPNAAVVSFVNDPTSVGDLVACFGVSHHVFPIQEFAMEDVLRTTIGHPYFAGKAHVPDRMDYATEWSLRWRSYRALIPTRWPELRRLFPGHCCPTSVIGIAPLGSVMGERYIKKRLRAREFVGVLRLLRRRHPETSIHLFGSLADRQALDVSRERDVVDYRGIPMRDCLREINSCTAFVSVDTWFKTWTALAGIPTTVVRVGNHSTVADNIFLRNWGFTFLNIQRARSGVDRPRGR